VAKAVWVVVYAKLFFTNLDTYMRIFYTAVNFHRYRYYHNNCQGIMHDCAIKVYLLSDCSIKVSSFFLAGKDSSGFILEEVGEGHLHLLETVCVSLGLFASTRMHTDTYK